MTAMQVTRILCLRNWFGTGTELTIDVEVSLIGSQILGCFMRSSCDLSINLNFPSLTRV